MTDEEIKNLTQKVKDGTATPEEELSFLQILNESLEGLQAIITQAKLAKAE
ncbi:MAG: hypothetical protein V4439_01040 [Patescibacteria group bacterium]